MGYLRRGKLIVDAPAQHHQDLFSMLRTKSGTFCVSWPPRRKVGIVQSELKKCSKRALSLNSASGTAVITDSMNHTDKPLRRLCSKTRGRRFFFKFILPGFDLCYCGKGLFSGCRTSRNLKIRETKTRYPINSDEEDISY